MTPAVLAAIASPAAPPAAVAAAKERWLSACVDGSASAEVQRLYEAYRDLVIAQVAAVCGNRPVHAA